MAIVFTVYLVFWAFTIYLSSVQHERHLQPVLPVIPQDSEEYRNLAESMLTGHGFSQHNKIDTLRSPGYPSFVAVLTGVTGSYFTVTFVQIILIFSSALVMRKLGVFFHSRKVGEIVAVLFLINPLVLTLSLIILTDVLFLFLFLSAFYVSLLARVRTRNIIFASILFTAAIYVRPMGIFAVPIFTLPFLVSKISLKEKAKSVVLMLLIVFVAVAPWIYRNYKHTGVADFTSFKAINLAAYAVPLYLANKNHTTADEERAKIERVSGVLQSQWKDLRYSKKVSSVAEHIILEQPFSYLTFHAASSLPFLFSSSIASARDVYSDAMNVARAYEPGAINYLVAGDWDMFFSSVTHVWWKFAERFVWLIVYLFAVFGFWKERKNLVAWGFAFVPAYLMLLAGPAANARYAIQGLPFILILSATGFFALYNTLRKSPFS